MSKFDVTALGELLIDYTPNGLSDAGMQLFEQNPGGAPANVLVALSKLGCKTALISKVGDDTQGRFLIDIVEKNNVDVSGVIVDKDTFTTLAFVTLSDTGDRDFAFARKPGADTQLTISDLNKIVLQNTKILHIGSLSLTDEPVRSATLEAIKIAKETDTIISYDPNYRAPLWRSESDAVDQMRSVLTSVDIMKLSDNEIKLITDEDSPERAADKLLNLGIGCVVVTLGKDGALVINKNGMAQAAPPPNVNVVDTTGAGDSFLGGFLYSFLKIGRSPQDMTCADLKKAIVFANAVAALCVGKRGAIPAMPELSDVENIMRLSNTKIKNLNSMG